ncbi:DUF1272 domain-containing protein [Caulobacter sp. FWC2]|uniref:DUF1272 domain-containing protein n=1 Tax=Caulobacter sp. FWC2 TaxID=69664 RepID=UPI000C161085|nr:DUF1272 domain-containing protein [Caulobacter sp. FWC2]PIB90910.1 hypothetical protein CSW62_04600 [Caulobacter sp. FWC2]
MLELRPNCECCDADLPPASAAARICTFEHTFCADCADIRFDGVCPDCGGGLVARPIRPEQQLHRYPASLRRVNKGHRYAPTSRRQPEGPAGWV